MRANTQILLALVFVLLTLGTPLRQTGQHSTNTSVTIPIDVTSYGGIVLQARINNSPPMSFYLDSGASLPFVINVNKAKELGLKLRGSLSREGGAGPNSYETSLTSGLTIALENKTFTNQTASVMSLRVIEEQFGRPVDGLVGLDLFLNYVVEIDYVSKKLKLYDPHDYVYSGAGESVLLTLSDGHFFVPAKIDIPDRGELTGRLLVDTGGCMMSVILTSPFALRNNLPSPNQKTILDRSVAGLGGATSLQVARATNFKIGNSVFSAPLIYISEDKRGALASSEYEGLIGTEILTRFKVIFDYQRRRLILEHNANFDEPLEYDMSGMSLRAYGADFSVFKIYQVLDGSPAARAGLRVGDVIEGIDDLPASRLTLEQILKMMKVEAREYSLKIKRGSEWRVVRIKTRRLI
jgi:PDZ domain/Aspartyl protease